MWRLAAALVMNLYFIFALALGAISGSPATTVAPQPAANVLSESRICASQQAVPRASASLAPAGLAIGAARLAPRASRRIDVPLTGAATPRAPDSDSE